LAIIGLVVAVAGVWRWWKLRAEDVEIQDDAGTGHG